jgi:hypothetical protein
MSNQLEPLKDVLRDFLSQMKRKEEIWKSLGLSIAGTPGFGDDNIDPWPRKEALCWIFADLYDHFPKFNRTPPVVEAAKELAKPYYDEWLELNLDIQDYMKRIIQKPYSNETLEVYLERIASEMKRKKGRRSSKIRSLRSFTAYLREQLSQEERGFIEEIFPEEMRVDQRTGKISRIAPATAYPIDIHLVAQILQGLARELLEGRPNAQLVAAEALGLAWICLTSARRRLSTQFKLVSQIPINCLTHKQSSLVIPTLHGGSTMPISLKMNQYLNGLKNIGSSNRLGLLQSESRSLRRTLDKVVEVLPPAANAGKITFLTLLSFPHPAIGQR